MNVKLTVVQGKPEGKELVLPTRLFVIGRAKECHLRPGSEMVSDRHCEIAVKDDTVSVRDLGSETGTLINGQPIQEETTVKTGDLLQIGPLVFAFTLIPAAKPRPATAATRPAAQPVGAGAVARPASSSSQQHDDLDVTDWLSGGDEGRAAPAETATAATQETQPIEAYETPHEVPIPEESPATEDAEEKPEAKPAISSAQSTSRAASDLLRRYFVRPR